MDLTAVMSLSGRRYRILTSSDKLSDVFIASRQHEFLLRVVQYDCREFYVELVTEGVG